VTPKLKKQLLLTTFSFCLTGMVFPKLLQVRPVSQKWTFEISAAGFDRPTPVLLPTQQHQQQPFYSHGQPVLASTPN